VERIPQAYEIIGKIIVLYIYIYLFLTFCKVDMLLPVYEINKKNQLQNSFLSYYDH